MGLMPRAGRHGTLTRSTCLDYFAMCVLVERWLNLGPPTALFPLTTVGTMGHVKRWMEKQDESGFRSDRYFDDVCEDCIGDPALAVFVSRNGPIAKCDFCDSTESNGMTVGDLFHYMARCVSAEWDDPINEVGWDKGFDSFVRILDSDDLLGAVDDPLKNEDLYWEFVSAFQHQWCQRSPYRLEHSEMLLHSWARFAEVTMTRRRFLMHRRRSATASNDELLDPSKVLDALGSAIGQAEWRMVGRTSEVAIVRARSHPIEENHDTPEALGSPPSSAAAHNRMSGAGIAMFYGADTDATATAEIRPGTDQAVTLATWRPARELVYLDLLGARPIPSLFDMTARTDRTWLRFLAAFSDDLAKPIESDTSQVEYIPTQIVTEFIRDHLSTSDGRSFDAIRYRSAVDEPDGVCWVVFAEQSECGSDHGGNGRVLLLDSASIRRRDP